MTTSEVVDHSHVCMPLWVKNRPAGADGISSDLVGPRPLQENSTNEYDGRMSLKTILAPYMSAMYQTPAINFKKQHR